MDLLHVLLPFELKDWLIMVVDFHSNHGQHKRDRDLLSVSPL